MGTLLPCRAGLLALLFIAVAVLSVFAALICLLSPSCWSAFDAAVIAAIGFVAVAVAVSIDPALHNRFVFGASRY